MKHIGKCLDNIQIAFARMPKDLNSEADKKKARKIVKKVKGYAKTLEALVNNPHFEEILSKLKKVELLQSQAYHIERLPADLQHLLHILDLYIEALTEIIEQRPEEWSRKADQLVLAIHQKCGGERGELRQEFQIALYEEEQLKKLITSEKQLSELLE